jgi:hypothetical protein
MSPVWAERRIQRTIDLVFEHQRTAGHGDDDQEQAAKRPVAPPRGCAVPPDVSESCNPCNSLIRG